MSEFSFQVRVYAEDTDHYGIVYHANHIKYMERARTEWLRAQNYQQDEMIASGTLLIITSLSINYHRPAQFDDLLTITVQIERRTRTRLVLEQNIINKKNQLIASGKVSVACVDKKLNPCRMPDFT